MHRKRDGAYQVVIVSANLLNFYIDSTLSALDIKRINGEKTGAEKHKIVDRNLSNYQTSI